MKHGLRELGPVPTHPAYASLGDPLFAYCGKRVKGKIDLSCSTKWSIYYWTFQS